MCDQREIKTVFGLPDFINMDECSGDADSLYSCSWQGALMVYWTEI